MDRLYNIYYLLRLSRQGRDRFERLLQFLQDLFGTMDTRTPYEAALSDVMLRQGRWEESLERCVEASRSEAGGGLPGDVLVRSLIDALAAGQAVRVKEIMTKAALAESMEPLWHATCVQLGEEVGPLPVEVAEAVAAVAAEMETVRAGSSPNPPIAATPPRFPP